MIKNPAYDLEERTACFGERVIEFCIELPETAVTRPLISQLVRAGTSIGANYCEADEAESKADFRPKIALCRKEGKETKYWCRLLAKAAPPSADASRDLWREAHELHLIFAKIIRTTDRNLKAAAKARTSS